VSVFETRKETDCWWDGVDDRVSNEEENGVVVADVLTVAISEPVRDGKLEKVRLAKAESVEVEVGVEPSLMLEEGVREEEEEGVFLREVGGDGDDDREGKVDRRAETEGKVVIDDTLVEENTGDWVGKAGVRVPAITEALCVGVFDRSGV